MTDSSKANSFRGRGSSLKPRNRFETIHVEDDYSDLEGDPEFSDQLRKIRTEYFEDDSKTILSENDSPDIPFRYSLTPYRGCAHGCSYCYARPTHEYFGWNAGIDFESKILVKSRAAQLLEKKLRLRTWTCEPIMMSGVTDCYQPIERKLRLTRACLEVAQRFRQPIGIVTKNALVTRDLEILEEMAQRHTARVAISLTSLDQGLTRVMEPRTSSPAARLRAMQELSHAGVEVTVMASPIIPGLNDSEIPKLLEAAKDHGATSAGYVLLRLPLTVEPVFLDWLEKNVPEQSEKIRERVRQTRQGKLNQSQFKTRMRGTGNLADHLAQTFKVFAKKHGLATRTVPLDTSHFRVPPGPNTQLSLF